MALIDKENKQFERVRDYLYDHGTATALEVSEATGVEVPTITKFLRQGRIEIPNGSPIFLPCEKCGIDIRFGRYCPSCATIISKDLNSAFKVDLSEIGAVPKKVGKMRFNRER